MLNKFNFYTITPLIIQVILTLMFFNIPISMMFGVFYLPVIFSIFTFVFLLIFPKSLSIENIVNDKSWTLKTQGILVFCWFIVFLIPFDIHYNGFKLANPLTYAEFYGVGKYIRHFTNFSWFITLFSSIYFRRSYQFKLLLVISIVMPIIFVDRNRLLMCFFNLFLVWFFCQGKLTFYKKIKLMSFVIFCLAFFAFLGTVRSGSSFYVPTSGEQLKYGYFPIKEYFYFLPWNSTNSNVYYYPIV